MGTARWNIHQPLTYIDVVGWVVAIFYEQEGNLSLLVVGEFKHRYKL